MNSQQIKTLKEYKERKEDLVQFRTIEREQRGYQTTANEKRGNNLRLREINC